MRSVIDQFLSPQVRPKPLEKEAAQVASGVPVPAAGALAQVKGLEARAVDAKSMEAKVAPVAEKPADAKVVRVEVGATAPPGRTV